jgi:hypothetical protein
MNRTRLILLLCTAAVLAAAVGNNVRPCIRICL